LERKTYRMIAPPPWFPVACLTVVLIASAVRGVLLRRAGVRAYGFDHRVELQSVAERFWKAAVALLAAAVMIAWLAPGVELHLGRPAWSAAPALRWIAACVLLVSTLLILIAQTAMGASWRVGVQSEGPGALVIGGLFAVSRNPVFVGMFGLALGVFLWCPTMLSAALLPLAASTMAMQVRLEEEALLAKHGEEYAAYRAKTPRWFWPLG
jgi:protein-S-isoprenylcysteine O-methyltransferase Ste14